MEDSGWQNPAKKTSEGEELTGMREKIDQLDQNIAELLKQRFELARQIGTLKGKQNLPVRDEQREAAVLSQVASAASDVEIAQAITSVYEVLLAESRSLQTADPKSRSKNHPLYFPKVLVIGLGLIGGALARQMQTLMPSSTITGCDQPQIMKEALEQGLIDEVCLDPATIAKKSSLIILAATPNENVRLLKELAPHLKRRQIVIDVTSSKAKICRVAEEINLKADFIGGHPFFGSEKSGLANSRSLNIEGKTFCLTPTRRSSEMSIRRLTRWLNDLGLQVIVTDAESHDRVTARSSHLIQLVATAVGAQLDALDPQSKDLLHSLAGPSLKQLSRLMDSPSDMWQEITELNRAHVLTALQELHSHLDSLEQAVKNEDKDQFKSEFLKAAATARKLNETS